MATSEDRPVLHDFVIIGGGVVGLATLRELSGRGYRCICLEKEEHILSGRWENAIIYICSSPANYKNRYDADVHMDANRLLQERAEATPVSCVQVLTRHLEFNRPLQICL